MSGIHIFAQLSYFQITYLKYYFVNECCVLISTNEDKKLDHVLIVYFFPNFPLTCPDVVQRQS